MPSGFVPFTQLVRRIPFVNVSPYGRGPGTGTYGEPLKRLETEGLGEQRAAAGDLCENSAEVPETAFSGFVFVHKRRV